MGKFYAVRKGKTTGIFETWAECEAQVKGFSGAEYKSFKDKLSAENYLNENSNISDYKDYYFLSCNELLEKSKDTEKAFAFVDGSYSKELNKYSCGVIIIYRGDIYKTNASDNDAEMVSMNNVAGELLGAKTAIKYCLDKGIKELILFYDYTGIEYWANGEWKANKKGTQEYQNLVRNIKNNLNITFQKVPAHTGVELNEIADSLAKEALGIT